MGIMNQHRHSRGRSLAKPSLKEIESICAGCFAVDIMISPMSVLPERGVVMSVLITTAPPIQKWTQFCVLINMN